jgi:hypothetical protein
VNVSKLYVWGKHLQLSDGEIRQEDVFLGEGQSYGRSELPPIAHEFVEEGELHENKVGGWRLLVDVDDELLPALRAHPLQEV